MNFRFAITSSKLNSDVYIGDIHRPTNLHGHYVYEIDIKKYIKKYLECPHAELLHDIFVIWNKNVIPYFGYNLIETCNDESLYDDMINMDKSGYNFSIICGRKYLQELVDMIR